MYIEKRTQPFQNLPFIVLEVKPAESNPITLVELIQITKLRYLQSKLECSAQHLSNRVPSGRNRPKKDLVPKPIGNAKLAQLITDCWRVKDPL